MQNYSRIYDYIYEYWRHLYDVYSKHAIAYLVTYYNIDKEATVWDNDKIMGGAYEPIGPLSGMKWNKYLLLPVFFIGETSTIFDAQEVGYVDEATTEFVIPDIYGITPYPGDMLKLDQRYLVRNSIDDTFAIYEIQGVKKQSPADRTYWQATCFVNQSRTSTEIDHQVNKTYVFFDYDKKIHTVPDSVVLTRMLNKHETIRNRLKNLYDDNSGFYFI